MNVGQLKKALEAYPDDMELLLNYHSDYHLVQEGESITEVVKGVYKPDLDYVMQSHPTMSDEHKAAEKTYLCVG